MTGTVAWLASSLEFGVLEDAGHDAIDHAREDAGGIGDGFADAQADFAGGDVDGGAAEVVHGDFKGDAGAEGGLFKDAGEGLAFGDLGRAAGFLELLFEAVGDIEEVAEALHGGVGEGDEVEFWWPWEDPLCWLNGIVIGNWRSPAFIPVYQLLVYRSSKNFGAHALVGVDFQEERVGEAAVDDVGFFDAGVEGDDAGFDLGQHAFADFLAVDGILRSGALCITKGQYK